METVLIFRDSSKKYAPPRRYSTLRNQSAVCCPFNYHYMHNVSTKHAFPLHTHSFTLQAIYLCTIHARTHIHNCMHAFRVRPRVYACATRLASCLMPFGVLVMMYSFTLVNLFVESLMLCATLRSVVHLHKHRLSVHPFARPSHRFTEKFIGRSKPSMCVLSV